MLSETFHRVLWCALVDLTLSEELLITFVFMSCMNNGMFGFLDEHPRLWFQDESSTHPEPSLSVTRIEHPYALRIWTCPSAMVCITAHWEMNIFLVWKFALWGRCDNLPASVCHLAWLLRSGSWEAERHCFHVVHTGGECGGGGEGEKGFSLEGLQLEFSIVLKTAQTRNIYICAWASKSPKLKECFAMMAANNICVGWLLRLGP